jgi:hypothetical protein
MKTSNESIRSTYPAGRVPTARWEVGPASRRLSGTIEQPEHDCDDERHHDDRCDDPHDRSPFLLSFDDLAMTREIELRGIPELLREHVDVVRRALDVDICRPRCSLHLIERDVVGVAVGLIRLTASA